jgi:uncharacterized protein YbjT (DUF2867 family)/glyoxylase-like metal-dependent hydrolase (beta-lactamase superfamily II)
MTEGEARRRDSDRPRVLVTGATGTVGRPLVEALADAPVAVRVASRSPEEVDGSTDTEREVVEFDLARPETWGPALDGVDRLFLLLPPAAGVGPVREFVDAAARVGVERVVFLSIVGAEKLPVLPHRRLERHLERGGLDWTFLRASYFMQNLSGIHRPEIVDRDELFVPAGDGELSFVDARDVADVAATVLTKSGHAGRAYDLTGPAALDFRTVATVFSDVLDRRIGYADPSRLAFVRRMLDRGVPLSLVAFMTVEYSAVRLGRSGRTTDDVEGVLGRPPRSMRQFVADHAEVFRPGSSDPGAPVEALGDGGLYRIDLGSVNAYLVDDGDVTLVDAGTPGDATDVERALGAAGYAVDDVDRVLLTHFDLDHVGGLAGLDVDAPVHAIEPDASYVEGSTRPPLSNHKGALQRLTDVLRPRPADRVRRLAHRDGVGGFVAYHTPGHTPGHVAYVHDGLDAAFLGDLAAAEDGSLTTAPWPLAYSAATNATSVRDLATQTTFDVAAPGHGDPILGGGSEALADLARRLDR